jgi:hypothetical protein
MSFGCDALLSGTYFLRFRWDPLLPSSGQKNEIFTLGTSDFTKVKLVVGFEIWGAACYPLHAGFLLGLKRHVPLKHRLIFSGLHGVMSQKIELVVKVVVCLFAVLRTSVCESKYNAFCSPDTLQFVVTWFVFPNGEPGELSPSIYWPELWTFLHWNERWMYQEACNHFNSGVIPRHYHKADHYEYTFITYFPWSIILSWRAFEQNNVI